MTFCDATPSRRSFRKSTAALGISGLTLFPNLAWASEDGINIIGPKPGYSPQIGTIVSMLTWMRERVLNSVKGMSQKDLDYLFDKDANTIGCCCCIWRRPRRTTARTPSKAKPGTVGRPR